VREPEHLHRQIGRSHRKRRRRRRRSPRRRKPTPKRRARRGRARPLGDMAAAAGEGGKWPRTLSPCSPWLAVFLYLFPPPLSGVRGGEDERHYRNMISTLTTNHRRLDFPLSLSGWLAGFTHSPLSRRRPGERLRRDGWEEGEEAAVGRERARAERGTDTDGRIARDDARAHSNAGRIHGASAISEGPFSLSSSPPQIANWRVSQGKDAKEDFSPASRVASQVLRF